MVLLTCELDWRTALHHVKDKVVAAHTCAVTMEIKNMMVSTTIAGNRTITYSP